MVDFCVDLTEPNVPNGVYTLESVSYTQKEDGPFGIDFFGDGPTIILLFTWKGCVGLRVFCNLGGKLYSGAWYLDASSKVLAPRTQ